MLVLAIHALPDTAPAALTPFPDISTVPDALASDVWARYVSSTPYGYASPRIIAEKLPLFAALIVFAVVAALAARRGRGDGAEPAYEGV